MATKADLHAVLEERGFNKYETRDFHAILNTRGLNDFERKDVHDVVENTLREHGLIP